MKCPKCDYISFDYNQVCPRCRKDVSLEAEKLNLPSFKPNPPALLGALTGETSESQIGLQATTTSSVGAVEHEVDINLEDSASIETDEVEIDAAQDLNLSLETDAVAADGETKDDRKDDISAGIDDLKADDTGDLLVGLEDTSSGGEEASELDDLSLDGLTLDKEN